MPFKFLANLFSLKTKLLPLSANVYIWLDYVSYGKYNDLGWSLKGCKDSFSNNLSNQEILSHPIYWLTSTGYVLIDGAAFKIELRLDLSQLGAHISYDRVSVAQLRDTGSAYLLWCQENSSKFCRANPLSNEELTELIYNKLYKDMNLKFSYKYMKKFLFLNKEVIKKDFFNNFIVSQEMSEALQKCNIKKQQALLSSVIINPKKPYLPLNLSPFSIANSSQRPKNKI